MLFLNDKKTTFSGTHAKKNTNTNVLRKHTSPTQLNNICFVISCSWSTFFNICVKVYENRIKGLRRRRRRIFICHTIIQSITSSEMSSLHLTHPSAHTLGAVGSRRCGARVAVGGSVPCSRVSPQSWTIPAGAEVRTHNLGLQVQYSIH